MTRSARNTFNFSWGSQQSHILNGLKTLAVGEISNVFLTDVTLACEGHYIEAHRLVLSLCSSFFKDLFNQNERISDKANGIVILSHVSAVNLRYILQFMYQGSVQIPQEHVDGFLQTGSMLQVEGLMGATGVAVGLSDKSSRVGPSSSSSSKPPQKSKKLPTSFNPIKRRRTSGSGGGSNGDIGDDDVEANVKLEESSFPVVISNNEDDIAEHQSHAVEILDDLGDGCGGDSDFGGGGVSEDEGTTNFKPEPSTSKPESQKTVTPNRKGGSVSRRPKNDSSSSSSDDDNDDNDDDSSDGSSGSTVDYLDSPPKPKPALRLTYELTQTFQTLEEAKVYIKSAKRWTTRYVRTLSGNEKKHVYDCVFKRDCPARMYLVEWEKSVDLFTSVEEHSHKITGKKRYGLSDEIKARINDLYEKGVKLPHRLLLALEAEGFKGLKNTQIATYISNNLKRKNTS
ncbi:unnamed protein product [Orchesella dallaii]|uniref:BTB domain-containing protein n=1 Tax=Orchesella dallaii TaxID=48710 RepID=A0ABP1QM41_9HEXA